MGGGDEEPRSGERREFRGESFRPDRPVQSDQAALAYQGADSDGSASASASSASSPWSPIPGCSSRARARISAASPPMRPKLSVMRAAKASSYSWAGRARVSAWNQSKHEEGRGGKKGV